MCFCTPQIRTPFCSNCNHSMFKRIGELRAELAEANKDAERLVWAMNWMHTTKHSNGFTQHVLSVGGVGDIDDCRVYIDAAMKEKK